MTFARARAIGLWTTGSTVTAAEFEHLDDYAYAVDGRGGTYAPASAIIIGGSGLNVTGQCQLSNIQAATFNCQIVGTLGAALTQTTPNTGALTATANGSGTGIAGVGGNGSGLGGGFQGGAPNGQGLYCAGQGSGVGLQVIGGSSAVGATITGGTTGATITGGAGNNIGLIAAATGTAVAIQCDVGGIHFNGSQPAKTADPGANRAHATNQAKAWGHITTDGLAGITLDDGYNTATVNFSGIYIVVTFARAFANATYEFSFCAIGATPYSFQPTAGGLVTTTMTFAVFNATGGSVDPSATPIKFSYSCHGRQ
jgi:hypothetical protein